MTTSFSVLDQRRAGILLHLSSLPDSPGNGDMGHAAYRFIEFLESLGVTVWQMLPLGPTHADGSPYQSLSIHAGNPLLISLDWLKDRGWLNPAQMRTEKNDASLFRQRALDLAFTAFALDPGDPLHAEYKQFLRAQSHWLEDYAMYIAFKRKYSDKSWQEWPEPLRRRDAQALEAAAKPLRAAIEQVRFEQFIFFCQWAEIKAYANQRGIRLFGDMPIFVAEDSADVWARQDYFDLDAIGRPRTVAGVPPDYFSATGQRWGNPQYDWKKIESNGFNWWIERIQTQLQLFDWIRIDHFRGFEAYWEIPASEPTAIQGRWIKAPGEALLSTIQNHFDRLPLIAEDLGIVTPEVEQLRDQFALPGMKILQFAFDSDAENPYLPHNHIENSIVYTGTHDNDTTRSWAESLDSAQAARIREYLGCGDEPIERSLMRAALASVARLAVIPLQDVLELGHEHRMNTPGTMEGNWSWCFQWEQVNPEMTDRLARWIEIYGRSVK